ncbi:hypothetical protein S40293_10633 [Stachybotrys chartarum IBT 40293]|nr:hypothetical protein S40293_10633 [Stachybotrys chartarum IBT 40293]
MRPPEGLARRPPPLLPCRARHRRIVAWEAQRHEDHRVRATQIATGTLQIQTVISRWVLASFWVREDGCAHRHGGRSVQTRGANVPGSASVAESPLARLPSPVERKAAHRRRKGSLDAAVLGALSDSRVG